MSARVPALLVGLCIVSACAPSVRQLDPQMVVLHESFWRGRESYEQLFQLPIATDVPAISEKIDGVIAPHHLFVGHEIARLYEGLREQEPSVVVLIGPNHMSLGRAPIQTTTKAFATPYGNLHISPIVAALVDDGIASIEPATFDSEHSISTHVAFIQKKFPDALLVPLALKIGTKGSDVTALAEALDDHLPSDALVIASVDFSHYLPRDVAEFHDQYSHAVIEQFAIDHVGRMEIDSPESIGALLLYLQKRDAQRLVYDRHTNSADFTAGPPPAETTSHFFMAFTDGEPARSPFATVMLLGDTIVDRGIADAIQKGVDPLAELRGLENRFFRGMTLTAVNLEGPITEAPTNTTKPVSFSFDEEPTLGLLRSMNVDIAGLANNHMDDAGEQGKQDTLDALKRGTITAAGFPESCSIVPIVNGTMGVCSMADLNGLLDIDRAQEAIRDATRTTDFVIASVHWGQEYAAQPSDRQRDVAKAFVAAGADAVIGHGPHVRQPMELVDGKPVFYSIGNFLFDQANPALNTGAAAALTFSADVIVGQEFPLRTVGGRPRLE